MFGVGDRVQHPRFGCGTILRLNPTAASALIEWDTHTVQRVTSDLTRSQSHVSQRSLSKLGGPPRATTPAHSDLAPAADERCVKCGAAMRPQAQTATQVVFVCTGVDCSNQVTVDSQAVSGWRVARLAAGVVLPLVGLDFLAPIDW